MHSVVITAKLQPGTRDRAVALWNEHLAAADLANEDIIHLALVLDTEDADVMRLVEFYAAPEGFDNVMQTPEVASFVEAVGPMLADEPSFSRGKVDWTKNLGVTSS